MKKFPFIKYEPIILDEDEMISRSKSFYQLADQRRSVRFFSDKPVPRKVIDLIVQTASTASFWSTQTTLDILCNYRSPKLKSKFESQPKKKKERVMKVE